MNRLALRPTDTFTGRRAQIGMSTALGYFCRTNAFAFCRLSQSAADFGWRDD
jgi:hypothetical protein